MDRDVALQLSSKLNDIKTVLTTIATNTTPSPSDSRSAEDQRGFSDLEDVQETEPITTEKK